MTYRLKKNGVITLKCKLEQEVGNEESFHRCNDADCPYHDKCMWNHPCPSCGDELQPHRMFWKSFECTSCACECSFADIDFIDHITEIVDLQEPFLTWLYIHKIIHNCTSCPVPNSSICEECNESFPKYSLINAKENDWVQVSAG